MKHEHEEVKEEVKVEKQHKKSNHVFGIKKHPKFGEKRHHAI